MCKWPWSCKLLSKLDSQQFPWELDIKHLGGQVTWVSAHILFICGSIPLNGLCYSTSAFFPPCYLPCFGTSSQSLKGHYLQRVTYIPTPSGLGLSLPQSLWRADTEIPKASAVILLLLLSIASPLVLPSDYSAESTKATDKFHCPFMVEKWIACPAAECLRAEHRRQTETCHLLWFWQQYNGVRSHLHCSVRRVHKRHSSERKKKQSPGVQRLHPLNPRELQLKEGRVISKENSLPQNCSAGQGTSGSMFPKECAHTHASTHKS